MSSLERSNRKENRTFFSTTINQNGQNNNQKKAFNSNSEVVISSSPSLTPTQAVPTPFGTDSPNNKSNTKNNG